MVVNHQENHLLYMWMFGCRDGIKAARGAACHSLPPICCCAYSLLFHPSNNGRRMRENASVSMAQPLRFHYYNHKSFQYPISPSLFLPPLSFLFLLSHTTSILVTKLKTHTVMSVNFNVFLKNNHLSCRHPHPLSLEVASAAVILGE